MDYGSGWCEVSVRSGAYNSSSGSVGKCAEMVVCLLECNPISQVCMIM